MVDLLVLGLTLDSTSNTPILVLKSVTGDEVLPLWVGGLEAMSIALALGQSTVERPLTHDLTMSLLAGLDANIVGMTITDVREGIFYGVLDVVCGARFLQIDCRPSDGIALALRASAPIRVTELVLLRAPKERFYAAMVGQPPLPDEAGAIIRRTLQQLHPLLEVSLPGTSPGASATSTDGGTACANKSVLPPPPDMSSAVTAPVQPSDEDPFARLLRDLEPASKHRM